MKKLGMEEEYTEFGERKGDFDVKGLLFVGFERQIAHHGLSRVHCDWSRQQEPHLVPMGGS